MISKQEQFFMEDNKKNIHVMRVEKRKSLSNHFSNINKMITRKEKQKNKKQKTIQEDIKKIVKPLDYHISTMSAKTIEKMLRENRRKIEEKYANI